MGYYDEVFDRVKFLEGIDEIVRVVSKIDRSDISSAEGKSRHRRLQKVLLLIQAAIPQIDVQLVSLSDMRRMTLAIDELDRWEYDFEDSELDNYMDEALSSLRPYMVATKGAALSIGQTFRRYTEQINQEAIHLNVQIDELVNELTIAHNSQLERLDEINGKIEEIDKYIDEYNFKSERAETSGHREYFANARKKIDQFQVDIADFQIELYGDEDDQHVGLIEKSRNGKDQVSEVLANVSNIQDLLAKKLKELERFHAQVFGAKQEDNDGNIQRVGGLKDAVQDYNLQLESMRARFSSTFEVLESEISGLLPGATSAGLASAFNERANTYTKTMESWTKLSLGAGALLAIAATTLVAWVSSSFPAAQDLSISSLGTFIANSVIVKLPIIIPFIWFLSFSSRRRAEAHKLKETYSHKAAVAKSYQGYEEAIKKLEDDGEKLRLQLMETMISAAALNAADGLEKIKHDREIRLSLPELNKLMKSLNLNSA